MNEVLSHQLIVGLKSITRVYHTDGQQVHALRGVDLSLPRGVFAAVNGRSGSGKTTLLNILGGLDRPTSGSVHVDGQSLAGLTDAELTLLRRHKLGFVFQSFALLPTYSALENVDLMLRLVGLPRQERAERARRCLAIVGLEKWMHHRPDEMSGGQQQRVAIARALSTRPVLILADEPTGELDTASSRQVLSLFRWLVDHEGLTILTATHDPLIDEYADLIYALEDGRLSAIG
jgi:ABC-type lipoprotein export system ATPase subunit